MCGAPPGPIIQGMGFPRRKINIVKALPTDETPVRAVKFEQYVATPMPRIPLDNYEEPALPMTAERKQAFLEELSMHGIVAQAAAIASPGSVCASSSFYAARQSDLKFAQAWHEALIQARGKVENEVHRRAMGWFDEIKDEHGKVVSRHYKCSDKMLELRIKRLAPEYREKSTVDHSVKVDALDYDKLSPASRQLLRVILETETHEAPVEDLSGTELPIMLGNEEAPPEA